MVASLLSARPSAPAAPARAATRAPSRSRKRRKVTRPPQPQRPEDFFSPDADACLSELLAQRAKSWKEDWLKPLYFHGCDSEPLWDESATRRIAGTTLRSAGRRVLIVGVSMDLERVLRLLTLSWVDKKNTADGHTSDEWRVGMAGALWRIGQHHREFTRRWGEARAQALLAQIIDALWK